MREAPDGLPLTADITERDALLSTPTHGCHSERAFFASEESTSGSLIAKAKRSGACGSRAVLTFRARRIVVL